MSSFAAKSLFKKAVFSSSSLVVSLVAGGTLALSSFSTISYAQSAPSASPSPSGSLIPELVSAEASSAVEEQIARLDAAFLTLDNLDGEFADRDRIYYLRRLAEAYSDVDEHSRAIALLDRAVEIAFSAEYVDARPLFRAISTYISIGEIEAAEALMRRVVALDPLRGTEKLAQISRAYLATNAELAVFTLSQATDLLGDPSDWAEPGFAFMDVGILANAYGELADPAAGEGLSHLVALTDAGIEAYGLDKYSSVVALTVSQLAVAQAKQGNSESAERLVRQALEIVREGGEASFIVSTVAIAYGYIEDSAVAEQVLDELMQLTMRSLTSDDLVGSALAVGRIAVAYDKIGNQAQSERALTVLSENFGDSLTGLDVILSIHVGMGDAARSEAVVQKMFEMLPQLETINVAAFPLGYSELGGLINGYLQTTDDELARERLAMLETYFKDVQFDPHSVSTQLLRLARAAMEKGDQTAAQRLLFEAVSTLETSESLEQEQYFNTISNIALGYRSLENTQARQVGLDKLQQVANDRLDLAQRDSFNDKIIRARAGL
ncbi:MAG: hypothetical protein AAFQ63_22125 [Cyanobacteria bacterium J06621_11]